MKANWGTGVSTLMVIENQTGVTMNYVTNEDSSGSFFTKPIHIPNGYVLACLHGKTSGAGRGSIGTVTFQNDSEVHSIRWSAPLIGTTSHSDNGHLLHNDSSPVIQFTLQASPASIAAREKQDLAEQRSVEIRAAAQREAQQAAQYEAEAARVAEQEAQETAERNAKEQALQRAHLQAIQEEQMAQAAAIQELQSVQSAQAAQATKRLQSIQKALGSLTKQLNDQAVVTKEADAELETLTKKVQGFAQSAAAASKATDSEKPGRVKQILAGLKVLAGGILITGVNAGVKEAIRQLLAQTTPLEETFSGNSSQESF